VKDLLTEILHPAPKPAEPEMEVEAEAEAEVEAEGEIDDDTDEEKEILLAPPVFAEEEIEDTTVGNGAVETDQNGTSRSSQKSGSFITARLPEESRDAGTRKSTLSTSRYRGSEQENRFSGDEKGDYLDKNSNDQTSEQLCATILSLSPPSSPPTSPPMDKERSTQKSKRSSIFGIHNIRKNLSSKSGLVLERSASPKVPVQHP
tara:strand:+ start:281 stop:892 length:612 start_codon:yes stop_codon:yes gene_type:complete